MIGNVKGKTEISLRFQNLPPVDRGEEKSKLGTTPALKTIIDICIKNGTIGCEWMTIPMS